MLIYPAIDLFQGKGVRLYKGDYAQMTVYTEDPCATAQVFRNCGAERIHLVDLEGAKTGQTPNFETVCRIRSESGLFCEVGGGIRSMDTVEKYLSAGIDRVILGTAAVTDPDFARAAVGKYGKQIAVGIDIRDGRVAIKGWTEDSGLEAFRFCEQMRDLGVTTFICTDISKDGAMRGTNLSLYRELSQRFRIDIIASGGVSSIEDVKNLRAMDLHGAIIGRAYYIGAVDLREAVEVAK